MPIRRDRNTKATDLAFMGIMLALNQILLYFGGMTSFNETFFLALASLMIGIVVIEKGIKNGVVFFISSAMMAMIIMPNKLNALGYTFIFGSYTIVKYYIEKTDNLKKENVIKLIYFSADGLIVSIAVNQLFFSYSIMILFPMFVIIMLVYDYATTVVLTSYRNRFKSDLIGKTDRHNKKR